MEKSKDYVKVLAQAALCAAGGATFRRAARQGSPCRAP